METTAKGPLAGLRIIDASSMVAGPLSTQVLADQGAEVIKVEPPGVGDLCRFIGAMHGGISHYFCVYNRNKQSLAVNLKTPEGQQILARLLESADAFVHNLRPEAARKMGLSGEQLQERYPHLVCAALTGFGSEGPYAGRRVYDPLVQATSGIAVSQGSASEPALIRQLVCDKVAGLYLAQALSTGLLVKERTGQGQLLDTSLLETSLAFSFPEVMADKLFVEPSTPPPDMSVIYKPWQTVDGALAVVMISDSEFHGWCRAVGAPQLIDDSRFGDTPSRFANWHLLRQECETLVAGFSTQEIMKRLVQEDVPAAPVNTPEQVLHDPQVQFSECIAVVEQQGPGEVRHVKTPVTFNGAERAIRPAPLLGQDSASVLAQLGYDDGQIAQFIEAGVCQSV